MPPARTAEGIPIAHEGSDMTIIQIRPTTRQWWDSEAAPVRAILDLAWLRHDATAEVHDNILALLTPGHETTIAGIADDLGLAEDYDCGLRDENVGGAEQAEVEVERLRESALLSAQLVASLIAGAR